MNLLVIILFSLALCVLCYFAILDFLHVKKLRIKEDLRRETIKNALCDISDTLRQISKDNCN